MIKMKLRVLNIIFSLFIATCFITSCLDDDTIEYEYSSDASITGFYIVDSIVTSYPGKNEYGIDTTLTTSVIGANYPFVINQNEALIYNPDSLPVGTDVRKVVVNIIADTYGVYIVAENDSLWEEGDSLNFERPVQFRIVSETGTLGRIYTAKINVHQQEPELLSWKKIESNFHANIKKQKAVYAHHCIYVFAEQASQVTMTRANLDKDGTSWSELEEIDIPVKADYASAMVWGEQLYILAENDLYTSSNGLNWEKVNTAQKFSKLLANIHTSNVQKLIAADMENHYIESENGMDWTQYDELPANFPEKNISFASYPLTTNPDISRIVLKGSNPVETDTTVVTWTLLDQEHTWTALTIDSENHLSPNLENPSMIRYEDQLYTFGGQGQDDGLIKPFSMFYVSKDNGITWSPVTSNMTFPETFGSLYEQANGNYSCIVDKNHFIWIIWSQTGEIWKGRVNRLGFDNQ